MFGLTWPESLRAIKLHARLDASNECPAVEKHIQKLMVLSS